MLDLAKIQLIAQGCLRMICKTCDSKSELIEGLGCANTEEVATVNTINNSFRGNGYRG
jgi:hypothetical protein